MREAIRRSLVSPRSPLGSGGKPPLITGTAPSLSALAVGDNINTRATWGTYAATAPAVSINSPTTKEYRVNGGAWTAYGSYVVAEGDVIELRETVTDNTARVVQFFASRQVPIAVPVNTVLPAITGTAIEGETLTASTGTWTGFAPITYARQWKRGGVAISGATGATYVQTAADVGSALTITVTATNAGGSASATSAATGAVGAAGSISPINGILNASVVTLIGASFEADSAASYWAPAAADLGFTGTVVVSASGGETTSSMNSRLTTAIAANTASQSNNLYWFGHGGNDVSGSRPYPGGAANMQSRFDSAVAQVQATGDKFVIGEISFRPYTGAPAVASGSRPTWTILDEANGSLPYDTNVILPLMALRTPLWLRADGTPYIDSYSLFKRNPEVINADQIHPDPREFWVQHVLSKMALRAQGIDPRECWRGKTLTIGFGVANANPGMAANWLRHTNKFGTAALYTWTGGRFRDGSINGRILTHTAGAFSQGTKPSSARVADADLAATMDGNEMVFVNGAGLSIPVKIMELPPGATVTVSVAGATTSATGRSTLYTLDASGETITVDNTTAAASNMGTFAPVVVPASGRLTLTAAPNAGAGSTYAILSAIKLVFSTTDTGVPETWNITAGDGQATVVSSPNAPQPIVIAGDGAATAQE